MRRVLLPAIIAAVAGCATPPPSAYTKTAAATKPAVQTAVGTNSVGERCTESPHDPGGADVYCGTWQQPSARIRPAGPASDAALPGLATASPWRVGINERFECQPPSRTSILGGNPAELLQCTQRMGGWPHVAMVALVNGQAWYGDAVLPAANVMQQGIGIAAGIVRPGTPAPSSAADALLARRLAAQAFSSGDIGAYDQLMFIGTRANLAEDGSAAEAAFRAALALQQKALGRDNPNTAATLATLALQLSNEGRYLEAEALFAQAERLAPTAADATTRARIAHYRGLDAWNQARSEDALRLLRSAEAEYAALIPASLLRGSTNPGNTGNAFRRNASAAGNALIPDQNVLTDPAARNALLGLIEARRNEGLVLRALGKVQESEAVLDSAAELTRSNGLARPIVEARLLRTRGLTAAAAGDSSAALSALAQSTNAFARSLPESKPLADTYLLRAGQLVRSGQTDPASAICRNAIAALVTLKAGTTPELIAPCLDSLAAAAKSAADKQSVAAEMFTAAQLAQGGITSRQIAQAAARLQENARDPKVAQAIRHRQDAAATLQALYQQRDQLAAVSGEAAKANASASAELDKRITAAQAAVADADTALQAASPNFGQLVQQVVPASEVMKSLHKNEAFLSIFLSKNDGWIFLIRNGLLLQAKIPEPGDRMAKLVHDLRAGIEQTSAQLPRFDIEVARDLYNALIGPVAGSLDGVTSLVISPSGPLLSIPFEVLLTGPADPARLADAPWLVQKYAIAHVPAPANFVSLRKAAEGSRATQAWFGFGDFQPVTLAQARASFPGPSCAESAELLSQLPALPYAHRELEAARAILGASASDELLGRSFTAPAVLKASLKDFRILHFATHALLPSELQCQAEPAIVASAPPGSPNASFALLTASDIVGMDLDAGLIILSACNSGGPGGSTAGESLSGLARAFFFAGARALMVTHWAVNDQVAAYLVADTLQRLRQDPAQGVVGALRGAQIAMLQGAGHTFPAEIAHPFYWAPFALIGEGGEQADAGKLALN